MLLGPGINTVRKNKLTQSNVVVVKLLLLKVPLSIMLQLRIWLVVRTVMKSKNLFDVGNCSFKIKSTMFIIEFSRKILGVVVHSQLFLPTCLKSQLLS